MSAATEKLSPPGWEKFALRRSPLYLGTALFTKSGGVPVRTGPTILIRLSAAILCVLLTLTAAVAQNPKPTPGDEMFDKFLAKEALRLSEKVLDCATTLDEWKAKRPRLRQEYLDMLG